MKCKLYERFYTRNNDINLCFQRFAVTIDNLVLEACFSWLNPNIVNKQQRSRKVDKTNVIIKMQ